MSDTPTTELTDERILEILSRYHDIARGNGALELVAKEITAGEGSREEILWEVIDVAGELGYSIAHDDYPRLRFALTNYGTRLAAELETAKLTAGEKVRIVADVEILLGVMLHEDATGFIGAVRGGTEGTFRGMHPNERLAGWALVDVDPDVVELAGDWTLEELGNPEKLVVPVHGSSIERVQ